MCQVNILCVILGLAKYFPENPITLYEYEMFGTAEKLKHVKTLIGMIFNAFLGKCASTMLTNSEHALDV